nr:MAG TPA: hypothetical protein [Caudoviricetes sp.]DAL37192.1 MAG TPA_asm: hypothetical protein [Caudoviricetes sp.]DAO14245.1 MAG TPA: hypothetical protein [Caudoviricetes sp.]
MPPWPPPKTTVFIYSIVKYESRSSWTVMLNFRPFRIH